MSEVPGTVHQGQCKIIPTTGTNTGWTGVRANSWRLALCKPCMLIVIIQVQKLGSFTPNTPHKSNNLLSLYINVQLCWCLAHCGEFVGLCIDRELTFFVWRIIIRDWLLFYFLITDMRCVVDPVLLTYGGNTALLFVIYWVLVAMLFSSICRSSHYSNTRISLLPIFVIF